ncbi:Ger(x)C family spore germination protein [Alkalihalobacillus sp. 1P02AB]|uniref:Ger(x)C family spore germination protein n=1 Tax=Alkalihalobacillus sp. 1P02AB TaxID=3132260 RepID=UPI0039A6F9FA
MKRQVCSIIVICLFILTSCNVDSEVIDELSIIRAIGYDTGSEENLVKVTVNYPTFTEQVSEQSLKQEALQGEGETPRAIINDLSNRSQKPLVTGQLRVVLFGEELANKGLEPYVLPLYKDPTVGNRILMAVVEESEASDILNAEVGTGEQTGVYIPDLLEQNQENGQVPRANLHEFLFSMYSDARDPALPIIKRIGGLEVEITGLALFDRDQLKTKLTLDQSFYLKLMRKRSKHNFHQFHIEGIAQETPVVIEVIKSKLDSTLDKNRGYPHVTYTIKVESVIYDTGGDVNLRDGKDRKTIEESIANTIESNAKELLQLCQDLNIDPIGVGELYRSHTRKWDPDVWINSIYRTVEFDVKAEVEIAQTGAVE